MDLLSFQGFDVKMFPAVPELLKMEPVKRMSAIEDWAVKNLSPREATSWVYQHLDTGRGSALVQGNVRIARRNDYDNGRPNVYVQLRETIKDSTLVWDARDDVLIRGVECNFTQTGRYVRTLDSNGKLTWELAQQSALDIVDPLKRGPSVRLQELFRQCWQLDMMLGTWLHGNVLTLREDLPPFAKDALYSLMSTPLTWLACNPHYREQMLEHMKHGTAPVKPNYEEIARFARETRTNLQRKNRIATIEQFALYNRLKRSVDFVEKRRQLPEQRPIGVRSLLRLQKRWINAVEPLIKAYL